MNDWPWSKTNMKNAPVGKSGLTTDGGKPYVQRPKYDPPKGPKGIAGTGFKGRKIGEGNEGTQEC